ncbi:flagellar hook-basal body complex protein [Clostridium sp. CS001]|uniref:flagellar hook-basal body complex protein n=1 Tax=Clostridium sp. CS001 TaxID=2880648 RepID=UPI001CF2503D|nr:flagellar hook-basal body complex protein [Clostridium sp. CS001]MCB2288878.1 flagellar hook-basal body complex protein [Clostridium sp. CS001]
MLRSLYSGISGMKANQVKLDVIGNNIANVGTTAFKGSRVRFQDMVSQSMSQALAPGANQGGVNARQVGLGVQVAGIDTMVGQGMMQPTSRNLDVAMDGEGYLMVAKGLVPKGEAERSINPDQIAAAEETIESSKDKKLNEKKGVQLNPDYTVNDSNGLTISYTRDGALTLDNEGNLLNSDGLRILGYAVNDGKNTSLDYDKNGKPILTYANADSPTIFTSHILVPLVIPEKIFVPAVEEIPGPPIIPATEATFSRIRTFSIEKDGMIKAVLDSGKVAILGQVAVASFKNPAGLSKVGGNIYANTSNSGAAVVRTGKGALPDDVDPESFDPEDPKYVTDNGMGYGDMLQGMLEMSNVDLAEQFTDMIVASRAFQAAGKTITTGDEILQDIINLKR